MKFIRIGDETINLDLITHVKEGCKEETLYGRSVRKTTDHRFGWLEVHFISGDALKVEGESADVLRRILVELTGGREPGASIPVRKPTPREIPGPDPVHTGARHDHAPHAPHAPHSTEEHRSGLRNGLGR
jgi:hypothetical protein